MLTFVTELYLYDSEDKVINQGLLSLTWLSGQKAGLASRDDGLMRPCRTSETLEWWDCHHSPYPSLREVRASARTWFSVLFYLTSCAGPVGAGGSQKPQLKRETVMTPDKQVDFQKGAQVSVTQPLPAASWYEARVGPEVTGWTSWPRLIMKS